MSTQIDPEAERDVDLARWRAALAARWWIVAAGVIAGVILGGIYSLSGGSLYEASALLSPSQAFSPNGSPVQSYLSSPRGMNAIATQESTLVAAAKQAHVSVTELRGHVSTSTVNTGVGSTAARGSVLVEITVQLHKPTAAADAANALGAIVAKDSTGQYINQSIGILERSLKSAQTRLISVNKEVTQYTKVLATESLNPFDKLNLITQADNALARQGNLNQTISDEQQQLTLTNNIERSQIITPAAALKTTARSRRNSVLVGLLLGLIIGGIAAIVADSRMSRAHR
jgi:capsular polysaccharide biosynthesis protein